MLQQKFHFNRWQTLIIILIVLGIFFRFINLDRKLYWYDETMTSLRVSGHTQTELIQEVFNGRIISVQELHQKYQYPNSERSLTDTINALTGNAEHSPLYYVTARFWLQAFGNSIIAIRIFSVLISLLAFPCIYWLCRELFASKLSAEIAVILIAISPFHVLYAQQAREYSLWTVAILLSSAALLRAMRLSKEGAINIAAWGIYAVSVALAMYSHPFSAFVLFGHGIYVIGVENFRWNKRVAAYLAASLIGLFMFAPWVWVIATNLSQILQNAASVNASVRALPLRWLLNSSRLFFDLNQGLSWINPVLYLTAVLSGYALYFVCRKTPKRTWLFILTLVGVTGLALVVPDLILGGRRSSVTRYVIPCFLGIQLAVAYLLSTQIINKSRHQKRWLYIFMAVVSSGLLSCAVSSPFEIWWHNSHTNSKNNPQVARIVNQAKRPLLITDEIPGRVLSFSHLLKPEVNLQLIVEPNIPRIPDGFSEVFLYRPSDVLRQGIEREQNFKFESVYKDWLWKLVQ